MLVYQSRQNAQDDSLDSAEVVPAWLGALRTKYMLPC